MFSYLFSFLHFNFTCQLLFYYQYYYHYFFPPFFLFFYHTSCTLFPTNKPLHPQCRRLIILEYEGELYRIEVKPTPTIAMLGRLYIMLPDSGVVRNMAELVSIVQRTWGSQKRQTSSLSNTIGVNRPAIVREITHFGLFPAFLRERPAFLALFRNYNNRWKS